MKYVVTKKYGGQCTYNVTLRSVKAISITQCECVPSALVIQRTMRMRHISPLYDTFPHLSQKRHRFRKKKLLNTKCVFSIFSITSDCNISYSKKNSAICNHKCILVFMWSSCYSCQTVIKLQRYRQIFENTRTSNFKKIRTVGAELFHADGQT